MLTLLLLIAGCQSYAHRAHLPVSPEDNTARLKLHPQFQVAVWAAPEFVTECFRTITELETDKANVGGK